MSSAPLSCCSSEVFVRRDIARPTKVARLVPVGMRLARPPGGACTVDYGLHVAIAEIDPIRIGP